MNSISGNQRLSVSNFSTHELLLIIICGVLEKSLKRQSIWSSASQEMILRTLSCKWKPVRSSNPNMPFLMRVMCKLTSTEVSSAPWNRRGKMESILYDVTGLAKKLVFKFSCRISWGLRRLRLRVFCKLPMLYLDFATESHFCTNLKSEFKFVQLFCITMGIIYSDFQTSLHGEEYSAFAACPGSSRRFHKYSILLIKGEIVIK